jgi:IS30 family transposase
MKPLGKKVNPEEAAALYIAGMSLPAIARVLNSTGSTILRALRRQGVERRSISDAVSLASRGDRHISNGYVTVTSGKYERRKQHTMVAENALGRRLKRGECVHHINCDKTDNRPQNLLICTISYHQALHRRMRNDPYWSTFPRSKENA